MVSDTFALPHITRNCMVLSRPYRPLKAALTVHNNTQWTKTLPTVLLDFRCTVKEDIDFSPAELVYGTTLRLPREFFHSKSEPHVPELIRTLKESMQLLRPAPGSDHSKRSIFMPVQLQEASHVFIRVDAARNGTRQISNYN